ncbi:hypothetical protein ACLKA7_002916 [Drosophila subpalustris]
MLGTPCSKWAKSWGFVFVATRLSTEAERQEAEKRSLCCCEYIGHDKQPFHILGCCCNCEDFDLPHHV